MRIKVKPERITSAKMGFAFTIMGTALEAASVFAFSYGQIEVGFVFAGVGAGSIFAGFWALGTSVTCDNSPAEVRSPPKAQKPEPSKFAAIKYEVAPLITPTPS